MFVAFLALGLNHHQDIFLVKVPIPHIAESYALFLTLSDILVGLFVTFPPALVGAFHHFVCRPLIL